MKRENKSKHEDVFDVDRKHNTSTTDEPDLKPKDYSFIGDIIEFILEVVFEILT